METCTSQLEELLLGLDQAINSVTTLSVRVTYQSIGNAASSVPCNPPLPLRFPDSFAEISRSVCKMLAQAVPALQQLYIEGCCDDAALQAFGASCPQLTHLQVDPMTASIKIIESAGEHLRSLTCLTLKTRYLPDEDEDDDSTDLLSRYVADALSGMQSSESFSKLVLDFVPGFVLNHVHKLHAPDSLREIFANCSFTYLSNASNLLRGLHTLTLVISGRNSFDSVWNILTQAPDLQHLCLVGASKLIMKEEMLPKIPFLIGRLSAGLQLVAPSIKLLGIRSTVQSLLAELPPLPGVLSCTIKTIDNQIPVALTRVALVFPNLTELHLLDRIVPRLSGMSMQHLGCLVMCTSLKQLTVRAALDCTTAELAGLFQSMPNLEFLGYLKCQGVDLQQLLSEVIAQGRFVQLGEYSHQY